MKNYSACAFSLIIGRNILLFTPKGALRICLYENHFNKDEIKRSITVLVLTSFTLSKGNKI